MLVMSLSAQAQRDQFRQWVKLPCALQLVGVTARVEAVTGAPTDCQVLVYEAVLDEILAFPVFPAGTAAWWRSTHLGGAAGNQPIRLPKGADLNATLALSGGTTPTADYDVQFWFVEG